MPPVNQCSLLIAGLLVCTHGLADMGADDLIDIPLEELMQMDAVVTTASKREEVLKDTPSAVFVISREDIRRSGVSNLPDALRMVPGVQVFRITSTEWAVSARGLGGRFSRYLLVLLDGRSQYTSMFSGVNWDELNVSLENIERIEFIRGPGGTLWGANAVNGVLNIITRKGDDPGIQVRAQLGEGEEAGSVYMGIQGLVGDRDTFRLSGHFQAMEALDSANAQIDDQDWENFRLDGVYSFSRGGSEFDLRVGALGVESQLPWSRQTLEPAGNEAILGAETKFGYYLSLNGKTPTAVGSWDWRLSTDDTRIDSQVYQWDTANIGAELRWSGKLSTNHLLTAGVSGQYTDSYFLATEGGLDLALESPEQKGLTSSVFVQDAWQLHPDGIVSLGLRYDGNSISDSALQPSLRGLWRLSEEQRVWAAISRAVSSPNRILYGNSEVGIDTLPASPPINLPVRLSLKSEDGGVKDVELTAYELGFRWALSSALDLDLALYLHEYGNILAANETGVPELRQDNGVPYLFVPVQATDTRRQQSDGLEWSLQYQPLAYVYLQYSGNYSQVDAPGGESPLGGGLELISAVPEWQHSVRSLWNLSDHWQLDIWLRYVDEFSRFDAHTSLDLRLEYKLSRQLSVSLSARNLGRPVTRETTRELFSTGDYGVTPAISVKVDWALK